MYNLSSVEFIILLSLTSTLGICIYNVFNGLFDLIEMKIKKG